MTAREAEQAAAALAVDLGMQVAQAYHEAAAASPGLGLAVALPSVADSQGRSPQGEGFDLPESVPALRPAEAPKLVPQYGSDPLSGSGFQHNGVSWPTPAAPHQIRSSIAYVSPGGSRPARSVAKAVRSRLRSARRTHKGR